MPSKSVRNSRLSGMNKVTNPDPKNTTFPTIINSDPLAAITVNRNADFCAIPTKPTVLGTVDLSVVSRKAK